MSNVNSGKDLFAGPTGRWATERLLAAMHAGKALTSHVLRPLDTLRHDEWKFFDDAVVAEGTKRLVGVADLIARGQTIPVAGALGKTVFGYEKVTDMDPAITSLDGLGRTGNDRQEFQLNQLPLPITHKDFFINLRTLTASRNGGESLDTLQVRTAGRVVAERLEDMLFNGGQVFGGLTVYGYRTHPDRNTGTFVTNGAWSAAAKTGENILEDVQKMMTALHADRHFGPYWIYVPADVASKLEGDFKANSDRTIRERIEAVEGVLGIRVADQLATAQVLMVEASFETAAWVSGEQLQTVQWDAYGGFQLNFKAWAIGVPLVRSDIAGRSGIYHMTT